MYSAEVLLDSINPEGTRLTTLRVVMPRFILAEFNTHRAFSRNAASSRAIPVSRRIQQVKDTPFIPTVFGKNQRGMQAQHTLDDTAAHAAEATWRRAIRDAITHAETLNDLGVHKQLANRILEPFCWVTVIVSATDWENFFNLRISPLAQPEIMQTAQQMKIALDNSTPKQLQWGMWHSPTSEDREIAAGRLARVSYESTTFTDADDILLCHRLQKDQHWSPFEHIAQARVDNASRNFRRGWMQWRVLLDGHY